MSRIVTLLVLAACASSGEDSADTGADSGELGDTGSGDTATTRPEQICDAPDAFTGTLGPSGWTSTEADFVVDVDSATFVKDCYGGSVDDPITVDAGAFDEAARFYAAAGSPDDRPVRAVGCVSTNWMDLSIVEVTGETFWGPWHLTRTDEELDLAMCD
jgi:hypothetical protein